MEYVNQILDHVVPIISEASKSHFGLISLSVISISAIVLVFLFLTARTRPVLSFVLAIVLLVVMAGGIVGMVLAVDVRKPAVVYDVDMLQGLRKVGFKIPHLEDRTTSDYELLDGTLERLPDGNWHERQEHPRGVQVIYRYKRGTIIPGKIDYRRDDNSVELFIDFSQRKICWRETAPSSGTSAYHCPYAVVEFE